MSHHSIVIVYLTFIFIATGAGILFGARKFAAYYQTKNGCTPEAARKVALLIAVPILVVNLLAIIGFIALTMPVLG